MRCKVIIGGNELTFESEDAAIKFLTDYHLEHLIPTITPIECQGCGA